VRFSPNLYLAALGPLSELFALLIVVAVFALLRGQADRRTYFRTWETSWVFFAVALTAGLFYERFVDPESVFYPASAARTFTSAALFVAFRLASLAMLVGGVQQFVRGLRVKWLAAVAFPVGVALILPIDTSRAPVESLILVYGIFAIVAYGYAARAFMTLPASRHSSGTRFATVFFGGIALLTAGLAVFYLLQRLQSPVTANPWFVRFARYGFYGDLLLQLGLAWAMVRLLVEDTRRENDDTRAQVRLLQDRETMGDLYDAKTRLLGRRAFDALVGLDFARASFGSVARLHVTNLGRVSTEHGATVADALLTHLAGVLGGSVREHDRVYRWGDDDLLIVMPRATPGVARARIEYMLGRTASLSVPGVRDGLRAEGAVSVEPYHGGEELGEAARTVSRT
jgi:GGDEF domain-containing protein